MTLHCAFIGFGKSTTRYHLPYVLNRKDTWHVAHISVVTLNRKSRRHSIHIFTSPTIWMRCWAIRR